jgi:hypothetical protein
LTGASPMLYSHAKYSLFSRDGRNHAENLTLEQGEIRRSESTIQPA